jgi:hypothetical protein
LVPEMWLVPATAVKPCVPPGVVVIEVMKPKAS